MLRKLCFSFVAVALMALFLVPQMAMAATQHEPCKDGCRPLANTNFAFAGLITRGAQSGTSIIGGLALDVNQETGIFTGTFNFPKDNHVPVTGKLAYGKLSFTTAGHHGLVISGQGTLRQQSPDKYSGTFQQFANGVQISSGIWSALEVPFPGAVNAYAFSGQVKAGPDAGLCVEAALLLNNLNGTGVALLPNGKIVPLTFTRVKTNITIVFHLDGHRVIAKGAICPDGRIFGGFVGPRGTDQGRWEARPFRFIFF